MESVATALVRLMAQLGHDTFDLLGYSMGGRTALFTAVNYPDKIDRLILESASPGLKTAEEREARRAADNALAGRIERDGIESFVDFWASISLWESQETLPAPAKENLRQLRLSNTPAGLSNSLRGMGTGQQPSLWPKLKDLTVPTFLLTGELDKKFCAIGAEINLELPDSHHYIVPNAGHTIHLEQPNLWLELVSNFLTYPAEL